MVAMPGKRFPLRMRLAIEWLTPIRLPSSVLLTRQIIAYQRGERQAYSINSALQLLDPLPQQVLLPPRVAQLDADFA